MPSSRRTLRFEDVARVAAEMFEPSPQECFGVELEWPLHRPGDVSTRPEMHDMDHLRHAPLPTGSRVTFEPGGQAELSTAPASSVMEALQAAEADSAALGQRLLRAGFTRELLAVDTRRPPRRTLHQPRYEAMEVFFAHRGAAGRWMMCNTASTQVNISFDARDPHERWHTVQRIGPVLIAAFTNSPGVDTTGRYWASMRQAIWWSIDPGRTRPVRDDLPPEQAWADYALDADVMHIETGETGVRVPPGMPFGKWMTCGHPAGWPTTTDLHYHLSTLFPPVRPRGWLELRMLDALPAPIRDVAVLVVAAACTQGAGAELRARMPDTSGLWLTASTKGLADPTLAHAAHVLFDVAGTHLADMTNDTSHPALLSDFSAQYVHRHHSPGDLPTPTRIDLHHYAPQVLQPTS